MNKLTLIVLSTLFIATSSIFAGSNNSTEGYKISVKIKNSADSILILGHYFGEYQYVDDTARRNKDGSYLFEGKEPLPGGIYFIVMQNKKHFEFGINKEQVFSIETDTVDFVKNMKFKNSPENNQFYEYLSYANQKQKEIEPIKAGYDRAKENEDKDSLKFFQDKINIIDKEVQDYKLNFIKKYPEALMSKVFAASKEVELPEAPLKEDGTKDSLFLYNFYKKHYFDNIDFTDDRMLRTPVFNAKLKKYINDIAPKHPDSLIIECDMLVEKARPNKEVFKYVVWFLTYHFETSKIMGYDAVFVHMVETYYMTKQAFWVNPQVLENLTKRAMSLKPILIGKTVPNLIMPDSSGRMYSLYDLKAKYIVLYFWDPDCGHCKTQTPVLGKFYDDFKPQGIEIFSININNAKATEWKKIVSDNKLKFINVWDPNNQTQFRKTFDVSQSPVLFVLDSEFKIVAKRLSTEQLENFFNRQFEFDEKKAKENK